MEPIARGPVVERRIEWAIVGFTLVMLLIRLGGSDIVGDDEAREVGIIQDILRGNVLFPRFNDTLLPDKPPGYHWVAAATVSVLGFSELALRLPSAVAGALLVWATMRLGRALGAPRAGLIAGLFVAATPSVASHARVARPDLLFVLLHTLAMTYAWRWYESDRSRDATRCLAVLGLAALVKGPVAPVLLICTMGWLLAWEGNARRLGRLVTPAGLAILLVLGGGWHVLAWQHWGATFTEEHLIGRYVGNVAGGFVRGEPWSDNSLLYHLTFYPIALVGILLPWLPLAALAIWRLRDPRARRDPRLRFLLAWAAVPMLLFTIAEYKLRYYLLPSVPPLALLTAPVAFDLLRRWPRPIEILPTRMLTACIGALALLGALALILARPELLAESDRLNMDGLLTRTPGGATGLLAMAAVVAGLGAGIAGAQLWPLVPPLLVATGLGWNMIGRPAVERATSDVDSFRSFAHTIAEVVPADEPLVFFARPVRSLVVYLDRVVPSLGRDETRLDAGTHVLLWERAHARLLAAQRVTPVIAQGSGRVGNTAHARIILARTLAPVPASIRKNAAPTDEPGLVGDDRSGM